MRCPPPTRSRSQAPAKPASAVRSGSRLFRPLDEPVAHIPNRLDELLARLDFRADAPHVHIDHARATEIAVAPDLG